MMDAAEVKTHLKKDARLVEDFLAGCLRTLEGIPDGLLAAMNYSLLAGGKRLRPVLCLNAARLFGLEAEKALPFASAIECIHSYSLIHDDLPAMDNDDLRRGKPSNHKQFGEATAILAGDALLTDAFSFAASLPGIAPERVLGAVVYLARAAGSPGMVGGQFLDMLYTGQGPRSLDELRAMHAMKTGALLRASCVCGALLAGADRAEAASVERYGRGLGVAFQITDDILDVVGDGSLLGKPVGSDEAGGKVTYPSLLGLDQSRSLAQEEAGAAVRALAPFGGKAAFLRGLAEYIVQRTH
jgi:geranylgeranyl diphosphate synthase type II